MTMPALIAELASTLLVEAAARFILDVIFILCTHDDTRTLFTAVCVCLRCCHCFVLLWLLCVLAADCCALTAVLIRASSAAVYCVVVTAGAPEGQLCACKL
jgi:hypothetical protein